MKIELDHIKPGYEGGEDTIENAIPVCFECHAEIHMYNPDHPRGRRFRPSELRAHKEQWLAICVRRPPAQAKPALRAAVGPIQALFDELDFNFEVVSRVPHVGYAVQPPLRDRQFQRAIGRGAISILKEELKLAIFVAYAGIGAANQEHRRVARDSIGSGLPVERANRAMRDARPAIERAREALLKFLSSDDGA